MTGELRCEERRDGGCHCVLCFFFQSVASKTSQSNQMQKATQLP